MGKIWKFRILKQTQMEDKMRLVVDRIEGKYAVCQNVETKEMIDILLEDLPENCKDGMCLKMENDRYIEDFDFEKERRKRIEEKRKRLWKNKL